MKALPDTDEGLRLLLGPLFRSELRGALYLRRLRELPLAEDDIEELRADAFVRYLDRYSRTADALDAAALARRVISLTVYHRFSREIRRRRAYGAAGEKRETEVAMDELAHEDEGDWPESRRRTPAAGDVVRRARNALASLFGRLAEDRLSGRGGCGDAAPIPAQGAARWLCKYEGEPSLAALAHALARAPVDRIAVLPREIVMALRQAAQWRTSRPPAVAQLAGAAISERTSSERKRGKT
jgi:hypothetical protein